MDADEESGSWKSDCRKELQVAHENEVFLKFVLLADMLGYKYATFGLEYPTSVAYPPFTFYANYAHDWVEKFVERHARHHGSRVAYGKRTIEPDVVDRTYYWSRSDFWREAKANNIELEWSEKMQWHYGTIVLIGLAGRRTAPSVELTQKTQILIDAVVERMGQLLVKKNMPLAFMELTDLERQYLLWVLEGRSSSEIAEILNVSKSSIEYMQRKLPERFDKTGIYATAFLAYRMKMLTQD